MGAADDEDIEGAGERKFPMNNPESGVGPDTGKMLTWDKEKNFGFIKPDAGGEDLFCHISALVDGPGSVEKGDRVTFVKEFNRVKKKSLAINVRLDKEGRGKDKEESKKDKEESKPEVKSRKESDRGGKRNRSRSEKGRRRKER